MSVRDVKLFDCAQGIWCANEFCDQQMKSIFRSMILEYLFLHTPLGFHSHSNFKRVCNPNDDRDDCLEYFLTDNSVFTWFLCTELIRRLPISPIPKNTFNFIYSFFSNFLSFLSVALSPLSPLSLSLSSLSLSPLSLLSLALSLSLSV